MVKNQKGVVHMNGVEHYKEIFERYGGMMRTNQLEKENILYCKMQQLCSDQPHATFTLRQTESALHSHTLALIPIVLALSLVSPFLGCPGAGPERRKRFSPVRFGPGRNFIRGLDLVFPQNNGRHECACHY